MGEAGIFREFHAAIIPVSDMAASRKWYEEILELNPIKVSPTGMLIVYGTGGSSHICIYTPEPGTERPGYHGGGSFPNLRADDAAATHALLTERGVRCTEVQSGPGLEWFTLYDPDSNRIDVCEYGPDWLP